MQKNNYKSAPISLKPGTLLAGIGLMVLITLAAYSGFAESNSDWQAGFHHPLDGWDHVLTMITVGIWAAQLRGHAIWLLPLAFVGVMSLGGLAGTAGLAIPNAEALILLSGAVFSLLIIRKTRFSTYVSVIIVAFFAFFHGFAHGQEISTSASLISYTLGFVLATLLLHGVGIIVLKLVVLCVTCLVAIFFSSMAQANQVGSFTSINGKHLSQVNVHSGLARNSTIKINNKQYSETSPDDFIEHGLYPNDHPIDDNELDNNSANYTQNAASIRNYGTTSACTPIAVYTVLTLHKAPDITQENLHQVQQCFYLTHIQTSGLDFKKYNPDINHSPGKDLLCNGVGLTSPPIFYLTPVLPHNAKLSRLTPVSSFEACRLQMQIEAHASGYFSDNKINFPSAIPYGLRKQLKAEDNIPISRRYTNEFSFYLTATHLIIYPIDSTVAAVFDLDLLTARKKIIWNRMSRNAAISIQPNPLVHEEFYA